MTYEEFKAKEDAKQETMRIAMETKGNIAYNKGLLWGLGFKGLWLYPVLKRRTR